MLYWKNIFKLPTPTDLGMSDNDYYMPSSILTETQVDGTKTWEDYYSFLKKNYPIRFFLSSTIPETFRYAWKDVKRPFADAWYYIVSHTIASRKYHLIDIRQPKTNKHNVYRYGWIDRDHAMVFAMFKCLADFVEKENFYIPSQEEIETASEECGEKQALQSQAKLYLEVRDLYNYWTYDYEKILEGEDKLLSAWNNVRLTDKIEAERLFKLHTDLEAANSKELDSKLKRLVEIRHCLWS